LDASPVLGFITVLSEEGSYLGGYLIANVWGRPLEFRLTTTVKLNRIQHILYGATLKSHVFADVIGKALVAKASQSPTVLITDCEALLDLRLEFETPVAWLAEANDVLAGSLQAGGAGVMKTPSGLILCHPRFTKDAQPIRDALGAAQTLTDLSEPFTRVREALAEARKMGVTARGA
jgi:hypothetical protein